MPVLMCQREVAAGQQMDRWSSGGRSRQGHRESCQVLLTEAWPWGASLEGSWPVTKPGCQGGRAPAEEGKQMCWILMKREENTWRKEKCCLEDKDDLFVQQLRPEGLL